jgi:hypothetical protein
MRIQRIAQLAIYWVGMLRLTARASRVGVFDGNLCSNRAESRRWMGFYRGYGGLRL